MRHKLIKALIWFLGLFVASALSTAWTLAGLRYGAIPVIILYGLVIWICSTVCKSYDENHNIDWCDYCHKKAPLKLYSIGLLDNGNHKWLHLCDKCFREFQDNPPVDIIPEQKSDTDPSTAKSPDNEQKPVSAPFTVPTPAPAPAPTPTPAPTNVRTPAKVPAPAQTQNSNKRRGLRALNQNELLALVSGILAVLIMLLLLVVVVKFYL